MTQSFRTWVPNLKLIHLPFSVITESLYHHEKKIFFTNLMTYNDFTYYIIKGITCSNKELRVNKDFVHHNFSKGAMGRILVILVKNHFFSLLNKFNPMIL